jgi:50S ribosomal subunit-associated GTPase HflX
MRTNPRTKWLTSAQRVAVVRLRRPEEHPWAVEAAFDAVDGWLVAAGLTVVYRVWQRRRAPAAATYLGPGKARQLRTLCDLGEVETVVLDGTPSPAQRMNLERLVGRPVVDRSQWPTSGIATPRASGTRRLHRNARRRSGACNVVLVGCAGAGKSALFAALTGASGAAPSWPPLPDRARPLVVTRRLRGFRTPRPVLVTDTPGLTWSSERGSWVIPAETDAERRDADLLLHVIDGSHPEAVRRSRDVAALLSAGTAGRTTPIVSVWTQADRASVDGPASRPESWTVSARVGSGCDELIADLRRRMTSATRALDPGPGADLL